MTNVNTADILSLVLIPHLPAGVAYRIIETRRRDGPFKRPNDLMTVKGIGPKVFARIAPHVKVQA